MEQEKVKITEVAERAGVSLATVSRVLNRKSGVSTRTRQLVEQALDELGYERSIAGGGVIGVITPGLSSPIFSVLAEQIGLALAPHGLRAVVCPALPGGVQERDFLKSLLNLGATGIVFCSASNTLDQFDPEVLHLLESRAVPYVCINGCFQGGHSIAYSSDDGYAAELSVRHLRQLGHTRIGMAAGPVGNRPADRRVAGYRAAMAALGLGDHSGLVVRQTYSVEGGQFATERLLADGCTAVVACSDQMALGAIRAVRRQGLSVPGDVSVIGYDDGPLMEFTDPPLTTVRQPVDRLAAEVARGLVGLLSGRQVPPGELMFQPEVVVRGTTGPHLDRRPPT
ncbi:MULTISPECIES: LacI family DNA-binding transcriptional regulator [Kitasatospora]|uniref:LacI family DNA-binding transcriptional regulator n=1 Tax=Kitasatospora acidiphila TaxID=2567942 RepID=A0A540WES0_9ACTN|nr:MULTISPECIES: LacI family DNA-binding transcriptional regulator [Kitasatospora]MDH6143656.1 LacI family repressor for deo operon, udp, cdd, tsx, nupC, and nupG [Kitasatospora sp. GP30]TQF06904.1 LacI family DNA-binding transcriptional regulator [Kitasatospora acidiphila]